MAMCFQMCMLGVSRMQAPSVICSAMHGRLERRLATQYQHCTLRGSWLRASHGSCMTPGATY